jgi:NADPH:quinone reductase-like Zn-dependent oxidoreductase
MKAAVVRSFSAPPQYADIETPAPQLPDDLVVDVLAAALHPRVRSQADGSHYTSTGELPFVPGVDGVARDAAGANRYFILPDTRWGSMAERTVLDTRRSVILPDHCDPVAVAAVANPAMSSWIALTRRIDVARGASVLVLGATGSAGSMAVQVARRLGATHVTGVGRNKERLEALAAIGADATVGLEGDAAADAERIAAVAADVDIVLDYPWGAPTAAAMAAIVTARADRSTPLTWVEIGSVAGREAAIPSAALRAARLQIVGSGQGSVSTREILAELPALIDEIAAGTFAIDARAVPLAEVEPAWATHGAERIVFVP